MSKDYWYVRSGILHHKYTVDEAIKLSADEDRRLREEMFANPSDKQGVAEKHWSLYTDTMGRKPFLFTEWFDRECEKKRRNAKDWR